MVAIFVRQEPEQTLDLILTSSIISQGRHFKGWITKGRPLLIEGELGIPFMLVMMFYLCLPERNLGLSFTVRKAQRQSMRDRM